MEKKRGEERKRRRWRAKKKVKERRDEKRISHKYQELIVLDRYCGCFGEQLFIHKQNQALLVNNPLYSTSVFHVCNKHACMYLNHIETCQMVETFPKLL